VDALVAGALVNGADVSVIALFVVNTTIVHGYVDAVAIGAIDILAGLGSAIVGRLAAVGLLLVLAGPLVVTWRDIANVHGADLAIVAHAVGCTAVLLETIVALVLRVADIIGTRIAVIALLAGQAATRNRRVVAELVRATMVGADILEAILTDALWREDGKVDHAGGSGLGVDAVSAVHISLAAPRGHHLPVAKTVLAHIYRAWVTIVTDHICGLRSTALGPHWSLHADPINTFVNGAPDTVIAFLVRLAASRGREDLVLAVILNAGSHGARVTVFTVGIVVAAVRVIGVLVHAITFDALVISAGIFVQATLVFDADLVLLMDARVHLAEIGGGRVFVVAL